MTDHKSAWITSMGIIIAAFVFGLFFYSSRISDRTIRVVGYATQDFEADIVKWSFNLSVPVPLNGLNDGYRQMTNKIQFPITKMIHRREINDADDFSSNR